MQSQINELLEVATKAIKSAETEQTLGKCRVQYLGKKGELTALLKGISQMSVKDRPTMGKLANQAKIAIHELIQAQAERIQEKLLLQQMKADKLM